MGGKGTSSTHVLVGLVSLMWVVVDVGGWSKRCVATSLMHMVVVDIHRWWGAMPSMPVVVGTVIHGVRVVAASWGGGCHQWK